MSSLVLSTSSNDLWLDWFISRESYEIINKGHLESLFKTFDASVDKAECIERIVQHEETVFIHKSHFGTGKVVLFHHLKSCVGNFYEDNNKKEYSFFHGVGKATCTLMVPDLDILGKKPTGAATQVPCITNVLNCASIENIDNLTNSSLITFKPRNLVPVPPFLVKVIHESISRHENDAKQTLLKVIEAVKDFDTAHNGDNDYKEKARAKCKDLVFWLYLVSTDNAAIKAVPTAACNSEKLASLMLSTSTKCLKTTKEAETSILAQVEKTLKRPFEVLAATSSSTSEFMEKLTQLQKSNSDKSSKSFKKIPVKYQNMILVASSIGEITELEYSADAAEFFKCSNALHAQVMLNSLFETENVEVSVSPAVATTLLYGGFLWKNAFSPSGFAASVLSSESIFRTDTIHEGMVLDYSTKFDMSNASLDKLTKTQVLYPSEVEDLIQRLKGISTLADFFFKKNGYLSQGLRKLVNFCSENKMLLRTRNHMDRKFIAKFICAIDERIYFWLKQCSSKEIVLDTDLSLIEFSSMIQDVQFNRFYYVLPPSVSNVLRHNEEEEGTSVKKKKEKSANSIRNHDLVQAWKLRQDEKYENLFRNKTVDGPVLSFGSKCCLKFHVKGICYDDCKYDKSHCKIVNENDIKLVTNYLNELRKD